MYNNPPAFQFYPQDFITGVMYLTMEERGIYITLLCIQWSKNKIPKKRLGLIIGMEWESVPELVQDKFTDEGDYLINQRLFKISEERRIFVEKNRFLMVEKEEDQLNNLNPTKTQKKALH